VGTSINIRPYYTLYHWL